MTIYSHFHFKNICRDITWETNLLLLKVNVITCMYSITANPTLYIYMWMH